MSMPREFGVLAVVVAAIAVVGCGAKKKPVTEAEMKAVYDHASKEMNGNQFDEARKKYIETQLGVPHNMDGTKESWYTSSGVCYYFTYNTESKSKSMGTGKKEDCDQYGAK